MRLAVILRSTNAAACPGLWSFRAGSLEKGTVRRRPRVPTTKTTKEFGIVYDKAGNRTEGVEDRSALPQ